MFLQLSRSHIQMDIVERAESTVQHLFCSNRSPSRAVSFKVRYDPEP